LKEEGKWGLTAGLLVVALLVGALQASAQDAEPSLGQKYKDADRLYEQGDYAGARKLLLEVKEGAARQNLPLNRATKEQIDRRLAEIDRKLADRAAAEKRTAEAAAAAKAAAEREAAAAKAAAEREAAEADRLAAIRAAEAARRAEAERLAAEKAAEARRLTDAQLAKVRAAQPKYARAVALMRAGNYEMARYLFNEVKTELKDVPMAASDRQALDANIVNCDVGIAAAKAAAAKPVPKPVTPEKPKPVVVETPKPVVVPEVPKPAPPKRYPDLPADETDLKKTAVEEPAFRGGDTSIFSKAVTADSVRIQLEEQEIRTKLSDGLVFLRENDFRRAEGKFLAAQLQVKYGEFPTAFKKKWLAEIQKYLDLNAKAKASYDKRLKITRTKTASDELERHIAETRRKNQLIKARLMDQWVTYYERGMYDEALVVLERIAEIDPEDKTIPEKLKMTTHRKYEAWRYTLAERRLKEKEAQLIGMLEASTAYYPLSVYPDNWKELSDRRLRAIKKTRAAEKPRDAKVRQQLDETVVSFTFNEQPVKEAVDFLQTLGNVNIVLDAGKLEDEDKTITLKLNNVPLQTALRLLTEQLDMKYVVRDGIVFISDEEGVKMPPETGTYDVRDLLAEIPNFSGPTFELNDINTNQSGGSGGGSSTGGGLFGDDEEEDEDEDSASMEDSLNDLIDLIKQVIDPGSWDEGSGYAIRGRAAQGSIIVTHTPDTQEKVASLLEALRKTRAIQVSIDIRFITISDYFLESIGFDFTGQNNVASEPPHYIDTDGDGVPDTSTGLEYDRTLHGAKWSFFGNIINSMGGGTDLPMQGLTGAGGFSLAASFLDDVEVNFILDAVQQSQKAQLMNAPRLTMMNGQRAYIAVSRQQNFVRDITVQVSEGAVGYDPDIGTVQDGIVFDVRPTVSADRRYVQMDLRPSIAVVEDITEFETITTGVFGGAIVQLPEIAVTVVRTTVNVPDGGTLLIGGLRFTFDNEMESGIPVLSKIPLLGKLFTRRGFTTERQNLVILVKPTIIIQEEQEEKAK